MLQRVEFLEKEYFVFDSFRDVLFELYLNTKTNKRYIFNKIDGFEWGYVKEYSHHSLQEEDMFILPRDDETDKEYWGENPNHIGSWRIKCTMFEENGLRENQI